MQNGGAAKIAHEIAKQIEKKNKKKIETPLILLPPLAALCEGGKEHVHEFPFKKIWYKALWDICCCCVVPRSLLS